MFDIDLFDLFRYALTVVVVIYSTIVTVQSVHGWFARLSGGDKYIGLVRRYVIVHGLRLRFRTFWGDVIVCMLLCTIFPLLWRAHGLIKEIDRTLTDVRIINQSPRH
jgi:hypothetical protein